VSVLELVGVAEIGQLMGLSRQRVNEIVRTQADFPPPAAELAAGRIWHRGEVEAWIAEHRRDRKGVIVDDIDGVMVVSAASFADMQVVGDSVRAGQPVVVELRRIDIVQTRRCIDFMAGAGYVADGTVEKLADRVFVVETPGGGISDRQRRAITAHFD
jgi:prophage regulatory protein